MLVLMCCYDDIADSQYCGYCSVVGSPLCIFDWFLLLLLYCLFDINTYSLNDTIDSGSATAAVSLCPGSIDWLSHSTLLSSHTYPDVVTMFSRQTSIKTSLFLSLLDDELNLSEELLHPI